MPVITLTTDFGCRDPYAAAMKAVLCSLCPGAQILDLTHEIAAGDLTEAALFLAGCVPYFPAGTVHTIVVDPGVGTQRKPLAAAAGGQFFIFPDNGVLTLVLHEMPLEAVHHITDPECIGTGERKKVSATFHGRDIFAPSAAALARGMVLAEIGPPVQRIEELALPEPIVLSSGRIEGEIVHIDRFGNLISNIRLSDLQSRDGERSGRAICPDGLGQGRAKAEVLVRAGGLRFDRVAATYASAPAGQSIVLWNSAGCLEIAVNSGSAAERLGLKKGDRIVLEPRAAHG